MNDAIIKIIKSMELILGICICAVFSGIDSNAEVLQYLKVASAIKLIVTLSILYLQNLYFECAIAKYVTIR